MNTTYRDDPLAYYLGFNTEFVKIIKPKYKVGDLVKVVLDGKPRRVVKVYPKGEGIAVESISYLLSGESTEWWESNINKYEEKQMKKIQDKKDHVHILIELSWTDKYGHFHDARIHKLYRSHNDGVKAADRFHRKSEGEHGYLAVLEQRILGQ